MGLEVSRKTAAKIKQLLGKGLPVDPATNTTRTAQPFNIFVHITEPEADGYYTGRTTYFNSVTEAWTDYDTDVLVFRPNPADLVIGNRYRAWHVGTISDVLIFCTEAGSSIHVHITSDLAGGYYTARTTTFDTSDESWTDGDTNVKAFPPNPDDVLINGSRYRGWFVGTVGGFATYCTEHSPAGVFDYGSDDGSGSVGSDDGDNITLTFDRVTDSYSTAEGCETFHTAVNIPLIIEVRPDGRLASITEGEPVELTSAVDQTGFCDCCGSSSGGSDDCGDAASLAGTGLVVEAGSPCDQLAVDLTPFGSADVFGPFVTNVSFAVDGCTMTVTKTTRTLLAARNAAGMIVDMAHGTPVETETEVDISGVCDCCDDVTFNCVDGECVDPMDGTGSYDLLEDCEAECEVIAWSCVDLECVPDDEGSYDTSEDCEVDCVQHYACVDDFCNEDAEGPYTDASCDGECAQLYDCIEGECVLMGEGEYDGLAACLAECGEPCCPSAPNTLNVTITSDGDCGCWDENFTITGVSTFRDGNYSGCGYTIGLNLACDDFTGNYLLTMGYTTDDPIAGAGCCINNCAQLLIEDAECDPFYIQVVQPVVDYNGHGATCCTGNVTITITE